MQVGDYRVAADRMDAVLRTHPGFEQREAMFRATHRRHAPWHVVDFNDQKTGRLNLIRHLLDHLPDHHVPAPTLELPPLKGRPGKERFTGPVKPIRGRY